VSDPTDRLAEQFNQASLNPDMYRMGLVTAVDTGVSPHLCTIQGRQMVYIGSVNVGDIVPWAPGPPPFAMGARGTAGWNFSETGTSRVILNSLIAIPPFYGGWRPAWTQYSGETVDIEGQIRLLDVHNSGWSPTSGFSGWIGHWAKAFCIRACGINHGYTGVDLLPFQQVGLRKLSFESGQGIFPLIRNPPVPDAPMTQYWCNEYGTSLAIQGPARLIPAIYAPLDNNPITWVGGYPGAPNPSLYPDGPPMQEDLRAIDYTPIGPTPYDFVGGGVNHTSVLVQASELIGQGLTPWFYGSSASWYSSPSVSVPVGTRLIWGATISDASNAAAYSSVNWRPLAGTVRDVITQFRTGGLPFPALYPEYIGDQPYLGVPRGTQAAAGGTSFTGGVATSAGVVTREFQGADRMMRIGVWAFKP
jgi:hypothetical protein